MFRYLVYRTFGLGRRYVEAAGLSTDEKPTEGIVTGSRFLEVDTGNAWIWDETAQSWNPDKRMAAAVEGAMEGMGLPLGRVASLDNTQLANGTVIEAVGIPAYVDDVAKYAAFGITEKGWYVFAGITAPAGVTVTDQTTITGAAGYIAIAGEASVGVAVRFDTTAQSVPVVIAWDTGRAETFVFKAGDLAVRNLDYRVTFYVYDIAPYTQWTYTLTADTTFSGTKHYYTLDAETGEYTLAEVTAGESVPANTYYNHSKVRFEGMARNITYVCQVPIDCPMEFVLPEIEDENHGCWFEIRCLHDGEYSMTLLPPEGVKVATEHTQKETAGLNAITLHYSSINGVKLWRFLNTHSTIPT